MLPRWDHISQSLGIIKQHAGAAAIDNMTLFRELWQLSTTIFEHGVSGVGMILFGIYRFIENDIVNLIYKHFGLGGLVVLIPLMLQLPVAWLFPRVTLVCLAVELILVVTCNPELFLTPSILGRCYPRMPRWLQRYLV